MSGTQRVEKIRCDEPGCSCVVAERRADGTIVIRTRHHGETHVTIIEPFQETLLKMFKRRAGLLKEEPASEAPN